MSSLAPDHFDPLQRRTLKVVVASQIFSGAGLAAGIVTGALLAEDMFGSEALAGVPAALFTLGSASAAVAVGSLSQRWGRRTGLVAGYTVGACGAAGVVAATALDSVALFLLALLLYGAGTATNLQARYAGGDLAPVNRRATSMSIIMVSATLGAIAGPNLADTMAGVADRIGVPSLSGVFILATAAYATAAIILFALLRPDPLLVARDRLATAHAADGASVDQPSDMRGLAAGATVMVIIQMVMVGIMTMTPLHMHQHGHGLEAIGLVIGAHVGAMYLPSLVTGALVDRLGRRVMSIAAGVTLLLAGLTSAVAPSDSLGGPVAALILLGLGWNFGLLSGSAMIVDAAAPARKARIQGRVDLLIALAGSTGGAGGGFVAAETSYATLSLIGGVISLAIIAAAWIGAARQLEPQAA